MPSLFKKLKRHYKAIVIWFMVMLFLGTLVPMGFFLFAK
jgi:hypothetical protein